MKTLAIAALIALAPLTAQAASGFCAAKISDTTALVSVPKDTATKADIEADFAKMVAAGTYEKGEMPLGNLIAKPYQGCLVFDSSDLALKAMKAKMSEIERTLNLRVVITGW